MKLLLLLLGIGFLAHTCSESNFNKTEKQSMEKKIKLKTKESYTQKVSSLGGAGYTWVIEENDSLITDVIIERPAQQKNKAIGAGVDQVIKITAKSPGKSVITIVQKRIWEKEPPLETLSFDVTVED